MAESPSREAFSVLIQTDIGLLEFSPTSVELDENNVAHNLVDQTSYVPLSEVESAEWNEGNATVELDEETGETFTITFTGLGITKEALISMRTKKG